MNEQHQPLGPHCDATLFTLLWSNAPGLQVLDPKRVAGWTAQHIREFGIPSMCSIEDAPPDITEEQWATVDIPWAEGVMLFTLGTSWHLYEQMTGAVPTKSAALHRVTVSGLSRDRLSLPFLVGLHVQP